MLSLLSEIGQLAAKPNCISGGSPTIDLWKYTLHIP
jgi:hypothetical protein